MGKGKNLTLHGIKWDARVDGTDTLRVGPLKPSDFKAKERNTMQCVLARAANRQRNVGGWKLSRVWIGANIVDIEFKEDPKVLYRYFLSPEDVKRVHQFDENPDLVKKVGAWAKDIVITLVPPSTRGKTLGDKRVQGKKRGNGTTEKTEPLRHLFAEVIA
jgi:hypothetical protein